MFGSFKKQIHEPEDLQKGDLEHYRTELRDLVLAGENCDFLSGAYGEFGRCASNPIPVNGLIGNLKYFFKLRIPDGGGLCFHRTCSVTSDIASGLVDVYETVSIDGRIWDILFFHIFHPRRSNLSPSGYHLLPYDKRFGDLPFCYGINRRLKDFPYELSTALAQEGAPEAFVRRCKESILVGRFERPARHAEHMNEIIQESHHSVVLDPDSGDSWIT